MKLNKREFLAIAWGLIAARPVVADGLAVTISLSHDGSRAVASVLGDGDGGIENGFTLSSTRFSTGGSGSAKVDLGAANPGVYSVRFIRGVDEYPAIIVVGSDQTLTVIDASGNTRNLPSTTQDLLTRFWNGFTKDRLNSVLGGAI
jgi:hypothetical protein